MDQIPPPADHIPALKTAVVILNWNGRAFLERFLPTLIQYSYTAPSCEIMIADNLSSDDSLAFLKLNYPQIRIILNTENGGFAKGYNDALAQVEAEFYVLLNSDIEVSPFWIEPIITMMEADPMIAAVQPKLLSFDKRDQFEYAGGAGGFIDALGYPFCRGRIFESCEIDQGQYDKSIEIFWASGAAMFVRASIYKELGGLDADFFAHMEEIDFCWRAKNKGYRIMYCPDSTVYHIGGGTLPKSSPHKTYLNYRNNLSLLFKNLAKNRLFIILFFRMCFDGLSALVLWESKGFKEFEAVVKAHRDFWLMYKKNKKKRKVLSQHSGLSTIYRSSIVFAYYLKKLRKFSELDPQKFN